MTAEERDVLLWESAVHIQRVFRAKQARRIVRGARKRERALRAKAERIRKERETTLTVTDKEAQLLRERKEQAQRVADNKRRFMAQHRARQAKKAAKARRRRIAAVRDVEARNEADEVARMIDESLRKQGSSLVVVPSAAERARQGAAGAALGALDADAADAAAAAARLAAKAAKANPQPPAGLGQHDDDDDAPPRGRGAPVRWAVRHQLNVAGIYSCFRARLGENSGTLGELNQRTLERVVALQGAGAAAPVVPRVVRAVRG